MYILLMHIMYFLIYANRCDMSIRLYFIAAKLDIYSSDAMLYLYVTLQCLMIFIIAKANQCHIVF